TFREEVAAGRVHPKDAKVALARELVARFHDEAAAEAAVAGFEKRFARRELDSSNVPRVEVPLEGAQEMLLVHAVKAAGLTQSSSEARKLLTQGAVRVGGTKIQDVKATLAAGEHLVQVGKLKAARIALS